MRLIVSSRRRAISASLRVAGGGLLGAVMAKQLDPFGPKLKVVRAKHHVRDLETLFDNFVVNNPHRVNVHTHRDEPGVFLDVVGAPLPNETASIIGDAIHNLRAALDHLAAEAVRAGGNKPNRDTGFPIYLKEGDFGGAKSKLAGAPQGFFDFVAGLRPYETCTDGSPGNRRVWQLGQLDNLDKHITLLPTIGVVTAPGLRVLSAQGDEIWRFKHIQATGHGHVPMVSVRGVGLQYELDGEPTFAVRFSNTNLVDGEYVIPLLQTLTDTVSVIVADAAKLVF